MAMFNSYVKLPEGKQSQNEKRMKFEQQQCLVGGFNLPLWKIWVSNSWDDDIPNIWKNKMHVPNHQPDAVFERSDL